MNLEGVTAALTVEMERWNTIRSEAIRREQNGINDEDPQYTAKAVLGEYNAHMRRVDSLWRQFMDDYKRDRNVPGYVPTRF